MKCLTSYQTKPIRREGLAIILASSRHSPGCSWLVSVVVVVVFSDYHTSYCHV